MRWLETTLALTLGALLGACGSGDGAQLSGASGGDNMNTSSGSVDSNNSGTTNGSTTSGGGSETPGTTTGIAQPPQPAPDPSEPSNPPTEAPSDIVDGLLDEAPELCADACRKQAACGDTDMDCREECEDFVYRHAVFPECAELTLALIECVMSTPCEVVEARCGRLLNAIQTCSDVVPVPVPPPVPVPMPPALPPMEPGDPPPDAVVCGSGFGSAGGATPTPALDAGAPGPVSACDVAWTDCSDGHTYRSTCVERENNRELACSCVVDGRVQGAFFGGQCPLTVRQVNRGCGWTLVP